MRRKGAAMPVERWLYVLRLWWRSLFRRTQADRELDAELRDHIELKVGQYVAQGMASHEARRKALLELDGLEQTKERCRETWQGNWARDLGQDLRYGARMLRRSPGFTAVAAATLALGIGANTAIFSIVNAVLLRAFPYPDPDQLVLVFRVPLKRPDALSSIPYRDFELYREHNRVFSEMAGNAFHDLTLTGAGDPFIVNTAAVTPEIFSVLGARPLAGRPLLSEDGKQGAAPMALISENLWRGHFGSNPAMIGQTITLDMRSFTVVGILPASFHYPDGAPRQDVWIPVAQDPLFGPLMSEVRRGLLGGVARLKPGVSPAQAGAELRTMAARLAAQFPAEDTGLTIRIEPYRQAVVGNVKSGLLILMGAVGLVLLLSCANMANLLLSRATSRAREMAVRVALGARRGRIVRQVMTESVLLGFLGGAAGVLLAIGGVRLLGSFLPPELARIHSIDMDGYVLAFTLLLSITAALAFGVAPALFATASTWQTNIAEGGERTGQRTGQRVRSFLVVAEVSLAMVLLIAGGLLIRSLAAVLSVNPGFDPSKVIEAEISLPRFLYSTPQQWTAFSNELMASLHAQPGFGDSALAAPLPMDRQGAASLPFAIVGDPALSPGKVPTADYATVSPDYFRVMRIPLLRGRVFSEQDSPSNPNAAIISETFARRYFPHQDPIGKKMKFGFPPDIDVSREIVGVVGDVRDVTLGREPEPMMYVPFAQAPLWGGEVVVRSSLSTSSVAEAIRHAVHSIDKNLPVTDIEPLANAVDRSISQERFRTFLLVSFGAIALLLAGAGIFGVISYFVSRRTREIGVRIALGAQSRDIIRLVLGQGMKLVLIGVAIGSAAAFLLNRLMAGLLYGISATDPLTFGAVAIVLLGVAAAACYIPVVRALRVDPMVALRYE